MKEEEAYRKTSPSCLVGDGEIDQKRMFIVVSGLSEVAGCTEVG